MKKLLLSMTFALTAIAASAQPIPLAVEPGSKGNLPELAPIPGFTENNRFGALWVKSTLRTYRWSEVGNARIQLAYKHPSDFGGEYYTLQFRSQVVVGTQLDWDEWQTYRDADSNPVKYGAEAADPNNTIFYSLEYEPYNHMRHQFRLVLHGGPSDGFLSNEVEAYASSMSSAYSGYGMDGIPTYVLTGVKYGGNYNLSVRARYYDTDKGEWVDGNLTNDDGYYRYAWYRMNPVTCEMTQIEGATEETYTPTLADAGYYLFREIAGDAIHCDFVYRFPVLDGRNEESLVCVPVQASPAYFGPDGFVLNTDYILPRPGQDLFLSWYEYDEATQTGQEMMGAFGPRIVVKQPGQYGAMMEEDKYMYNMVMLSPDLMAQGYVLTFAYDHAFDENNPLWYRECQLMADRYQIPLTVKAEYAGRPVPTTIDVLGEDINGQMVVKQTAMLEDGQVDGVTIEAGLYSLGEGYYVVARATGSTAETFYPSALTMDEATRVVPAYDEDYNAPTITIAVRDITEGIEAIDHSPLTIHHYYTLGGHRLAAPQRGLNLVRQADGTVHKVIVSN